jgi:hypothetical protein
MITTLYFYHFCLLYNSVLLHLSLILNIAPIGFSLIYEIGSGGNQLILYNGI